MRRVKRPAKKQAHRHTLKARETASKSEKSQARVRKREKEKLR